MKAPVFMPGIMGTETLVLVVGPRPVAQDQRLAPDCKPVCGSKTFMPDRLISDWRAGRNKDANTYVIAIAR
jgi:hypothetical protein